ncbi:hypothetical protein [Xanthomonas sp. 4461]|uniref:hypothetical protein n=1 Tax=Xanthomonas sp. 4461 TaxID=3035313 RepID=UPI002167A830|nr:hypothetical protein [Xanthomonas sp. 4461]MCS3809774.1 hypothetical protein [Xanthomonas sp. 4461]
MAAMFNRVSALNLGQASMSEVNAIRAAITSQDIDALLFALAKRNKREGAPFLAEVLLAEWHNSHEDIVFELGLIG